MLGALEASALFLRSGEPTSVPPLLGAREGQCTRVASWLLGGKRRGGQRAKISLEIESDETTARFLDNQASLRVAKLA